MTISPSSAQAKIAANRSQIKVKEFISTKAPTAPVLDNKIIILEFWASWCIPCINAFPHINDLVDTFASDDVLFISLNSYDNTDKIKSLLKEKELHSLVALDDGKQSLKNFGVNLLPKTFLLNKAGEVVWSGEPGQLTKELLGTFIKTGELIKPQTTDLAFSYSIQPTADRSISRISNYTGDSYGFKFENKDISTILAQLMITQNRRDNEFKFTGTPPIEPKIDLNFKASSSLEKKQIYQTVLQNLVHTFSFTQHTKKEEQRVVELRIVDKKLFQTHVVANDKKYRQQKLPAGLAALESATAGKLERHIQYLSKLPVYFTNPPNDHFDVSYHHDDLKKTKKQLRELYGIQLAIVKKEVEVIEFKFK